MHRQSPKIVFCILQIVMSGCVSRTTVQPVRLDQSSHDSVKPSSLTQYINAVYKVSHEESVQDADAYNRVLKENADVQELAKRVTQDPADVKSKNRLATAYLEHGLTWRAYELFTELQFALPNDPGLHLGLARIWDAWGNYDLARQYGIKAIQFDPKSAAAYDTFGRICLHTAELGQAISSFAKAHELDPENPIPLANAGYAFMLQSNWQNAKTNLEQALALDPAQTQANNNLAIVYGQMGNYDAALALLKAKSQPTPTASFQDALNGDTGAMKSKPANPPTPKPAKAPSIVTLSPWPNTNTKPALPPATPTTTAPESAPAASTLPAKTTDSANTPLSSATITTAAPPKAALVEKPTTPTAIFPKPAGGAAASIASVPAATPAAVPAAKKTTSTTTAQSAATPKTSQPTASVSMPTAGVSPNAPQPPTPAPAVAPATHSTVAPSTPSTTTSVTPTVTPAPLTAAKPVVVTPTAFVEATASAPLTDSQRSVIAEPRLLGKDATSNVAVHAVEPISELEADWRTATDSSVESRSTPAPEGTQVESSSQAANISTTAAKVAPTNVIANTPPPQTAAKQEEDKPINAGGGATFPVRTMGLAAAISVLGAVLGQAFAKGRGMIIGAAIGPVVQILFHFMPF